jgi:hypothetical protein
MQAGSNSEPFNHITHHPPSAGVNRLWRQCAHLSDGLLHELSLKVAHLHKMEAAGKASYHKRFLSAEGCYSFKAAHTKGVRIKVRRSRRMLGRAVCQGGGQSQLPQALPLC